MKTELLKLLCRNARYTNEELAVMLGSDEKTVAETIEELEKYETILGKNLTNKEIMEITKKRKG